MRNFSAPLFERKTRRIVAIKTSDLSTVPPLWLSPVQHLTYKGDPAKIEEKECCWLLWSIFWMIHACWSGDNASCHIFDDFWGILNQRSPLIGIYRSLNIYERKSGVPQICIHSTAADVNTGNVFQNAQRRLSKNITIVELCRCLLLFCPVHLNCIHQLFCNQAVSL